VSVNANDEIQLLGRKLLQHVDRIMDCLDGIDSSQLNWSPTDEDTNSLGVIATHIMGNVTQNVFVVLGGEEDHRDRDAEFRAKPESAVELRQQWADLRSRVEAKLAEFSPDILEREFDHPRRGTSSGRELLLNAALHAAEHAGHAELTRDLLKTKG
jgi:hypothetical protein